MAEQNSLASIEDGLRQLYQVVRQVHSFLNKPEVKEKIRLFFERLKTLPDDTKKFLRDLAYRGWFFTDEMTLNEISVFYNLTTAQHSVDEAQIDAYMEKLVEKYTEHIKQTLYARYPTRKGVLESAFNAHDRGEYNLSIPAFLAQADGIGTQLLSGISPFSRKTSNASGLLATAEEINRLSTQVDTALIEPLGLPIGMTAKSTSPERLQHPHLYNRHEVLHGISVDYGTKTNSLKAISLLGHLATVFHDVVEEYKRISTS